MSSQHFCPVCGIYLYEPYIKCGECQDPPRLFCLQCFSKGVNYENHHCTHKYVVVRNNFTVFEPGWLAPEELKLLNAIVSCGVGNWADIAKIVGSKTKEECENHYMMYYIYNPVPPLPSISEPQIISKVHSVPVACTATHDPPRPVVGSDMYRDMAGYMPARSDFVTEYDDYSELDIKDLDSIDEDDPFLKELELAVVRIYCHRLRERARRKSIIRQYGLINFQKNIEEWRRYELLGPAVTDKMKGLMRLLKPFKFDQFMEGALYEQKLKARIKLLQQCSKDGISKLRDIGTYLKFAKEKREKPHKAIFDDVLNCLKTDLSAEKFLQQQMLKDRHHDFAGNILPVRRPAPPLNITGLPGFMKLSDKERELCANLRIYPFAYLQYKDMLVNEYRKLGYLRLANARTVVKIDVNKTRKIYDLLLAEGAVSK